MNCPRASFFWGYLSIAVATLVASCTKQCPCEATTSAATTTCGAERATQPTPQSADVVGIWGGYWSPSNGKVETERYLFSKDGRWGWLATNKEEGCLERGVAQRSGRWSMQGDQLVLEEHQRKEIAGCKDSRAQGIDKVRDKAAAGPLVCREPALNEVRNTTALVERVAVGQCPPNREAEQQDKSYACLSIGGKAFWRHPQRETEDEALFLGEK
jgi:hypothetical protein